MLFLCSSAPQIDLGGRTDVDGRTDVGGWVGK